MKYLLIMLMAMMPFASAEQTGTTSPAIIPVPVEQVNSSMNMAQKRVRDAAVKISTGGGGHGSGSYIVYKDVHLIFTAQHVTDGPLGSIYYVYKDKEMRLATLVWADEAADMAVLHY